MMNGKSICKVLKEICKRIAEKNLFLNEMQDCHFCECVETCTTYESEQTFIQRQLIFCRKAGKVIALVGFVSGLLAFMVCNEVQASERRMLNQELLFQNKKSYVKSRMLSGKKRTFSKKKISNRIVRSSDRTNSMKVIDVCEQMPTFPGGYSAFMSYMGSHVQYPASYEGDAGGYIIVGFVVERDGSITNVSVIKGVDSTLDEAAVKVVQQMPKWIPGRQNGKTVRVKYNVPVVFRFR